MKLLAILFKLILKIKPLRKHYFGIYKKIILPKKLFNNLSFNTTYDSSLLIKVNLSDWIQQQIYFVDYSDLNGISYLKKQLKAGNVFIDIGANIGAYSLIASKLVGSNGKVVSFEPVTSICKQLKQNIKLNNLTNIVVEPKAVFDKNTTLELFISDHQNMGMSSILHHSHETGEKQSVQAITIDEYVKIKSLLKIDFIKLDIEGAEINALRGMKQTILKFSPIILMEISDGILENSTTNSTVIYDFMNELNYTPYNINIKGEMLAFNANNANYHNYVFLPNND